MRAIGFFGTVLALMMLAACDGSGNPASPDAVSRVPNVAGTYRGNVDAFQDGVYVGTFSMTINVQQANTQVTLTGNFEGVTLPPASGVIDATGRLTITSSGSSGVTQDANCGAWTAVAVSYAFSGNTLTISETYNTSWCGQVRITGTLTR